MILYLKRKMLLMTWKLLGLLKLTPVPNVVMTLIIMLARPIVMVVGKATMSPIEFENKIVKPLSEIERYSVLTDRFKNNMELCQDLGDIAMLKFWKKQYWQASSYHARLIKEFYFNKEESGNDHS